jgi:hypothetical protein
MNCPMQLRTHIRVGMTQVSASYFSPPTLNLALLHHTSNSQSRPVPWKNVQTIGLIFRM